ncbi:MAG: hypothetical protein ACRDRH_27485 [Pseudonocardia sp.]
MGGAGATDAAGAAHAFTQHLATAAADFSLGAYLYQFDLYCVRASRAGAHGPFIELPNHDRLRISAT